MTAKEYLYQAYIIDKQINLKLAKAQQMRESLYGREVNLDNIGGQHAASDSLGSAIVKVIAYEQEANKLIDKLVDKRLEIEKVISAITNPIQKEILERRYLLCQPFKNKYDKETGVLIAKGIKEDMSFSYDWVVHQHGEALKKIKFIYKTEHAKTLKNIIKV